MVSLLVFLQAKDRFGLDKRDERNRIPAEYVNRLKGRKVDPHAVTAPK